MTAMTLQCLEPYQDQEEVKEAIEKMHGQISVASKEGEGTAFTVVLPNRN